MKRTLPATSGVLPGEAITCQKGAITVHRSLRVLCGAALVAMLTVLALLPAAGHTVAANHGARPAVAAAPLVGPKAYYLALGDSIVFGYQQNGDWTHALHHVCLPRLSDQVLAQHYSVARALMEVGSSSPVPCSRS